MTKKLEEIRDELAKELVERIYCGGPRQTMEIASGCFDIGFNAAVQELMPVVEAARELLEVESDINSKKVEVVGGVKYYPIGGDVNKNAAYFKLDRALAKVGIE